MEYLFFNSFDCHDHMADYRVLCWQLMLCGMQEIDVDDWQRNTKYKSYSPHSQQVVWFWKVRHTLLLSGDFCASAKVKWCRTHFLFMWFVHVSACLSVHNVISVFITSAKEVMFLPVFVCLFVCL